MSTISEVKQLLNVGIVAAFATLAFVGTTVIRIPIPATGGYFNLGDTFVMIAALLYGPFIGGLVGFIGPALADAVGYPQFILATAIVKGLEGAAIGTIAAKSAGSSLARPVVALSVGIAILACGYFLFEAFIYSFFNFDWRFSHYSITFGKFDFYILQHQRNRNLAFISPIGKTASS